MTVVIVSYKIKPGMRDQMVKEIQESGIGEMYRLQPGNIVWNFSLPVNYEDTFYLTDVWQDEASVEAHMLCEPTPIWGAIKEKYIIDKVVRRYDF